MKSGKIVGGVLSPAVALAGLLATYNPARAEPPRKALTHESLKDMLENMGYDLEEIKSTGGTPMYKIKFERDGWTIVTYVSLSRNGSMVWVSAPLKDVPDDVSSPEPLRKLLTESDNIGPSHFTLKGKRIYMNTPLENRDITPVRLRAAINDTASNIKATRDLWDTDNWPRGGDNGSRLQRQPEKKGEGKGGAEKY